LPVCWLIKHLEVPVNQSVIEPVFFYLAIAANELLKSVQLFRQFFLAVRLDDPAGHGLQNFSEVKNVELDLLFKVIFYQSLVEFYLTFLYQAVNGFWLYQKIFEMSRKSFNHFLRIF
jgi:hypothetical protein